MTGLIGPGDRKSVQPMAERLAPGDYDQLHHFVAAGVWDMAPLETELLVQADKLVGGGDAVMVIDDTRPFRSLGKRQYQGGAVRFLSLMGCRRNTPGHLRRKRPADPNYVRSMALVRNRPDQCASEHWATTLYWHHDRAPASSNRSAMPVRCWYQQLGQARFCALCFRSNRGQIRWPLGRGEFPQVARVCI